MLTPSNSGIGALFAKLESIGNASELSPDPEATNTVLALYYQALKETDNATKNDIFARLACLPVNKMAEIIVRCRVILENNAIPVPRPNYAPPVGPSAPPTFVQPLSVLPIEDSNYSEEQEQVKSVEEKSVEAKPLDDGLMATGLV